MPRRASLLRHAIVLGALAAVELGCRAGLVSAQLLPAPSAIAVALYGLLASGALAADIATTSRNIALASVIAAAGGIALGVAIHALPRLRRALDPFLASYYAVPFFVFYPVFIVLFGMGDGPIVAMGALFGIVAMIIAALNGLDRVPLALLKTARLYRMGPLATALRITLPSAAPHLMTGVKLAITYCFIAVIAAEFILSSSGLGYSIAYAFNNFETLRMYAIVLLILAVSIMLNGVLRAIEQAALRRRGL
jgi:NitT/TauT family transport system permease protein